MTILRSEGAGDPDLGFYNGVVANSLRINDGHTLSNTFSTPTSSTTMSFGGWLKFTKNGYANTFSQGLGGSGVVQAFLRLDGNSRLVVDSYDGSSMYFNYITTRILRDLNTWYHIWVQIDSTDGTQADRVKIYVNGVRETAFDTATEISTGSSAVVGWNTAVTHYIGYNSAGNSFDGYIADWYFLDGQDVSPIDTVGEFKEGIFIPKAYSATFGNNGFHLKFIGTGTSTSSGSVANPTNIGDDSSGQNNHWAVTSSTVDSHDANLPDCPENNFPTMNRLVKTNGAASSAFSQGNLSIDKSGTTYSYFQSTFGVKTGKWYAECRPAGIINTIMIGVTEAHMETYRTGDSVDPHTTAGTAWYTQAGDGYFDGSNVAAGTFSSNTTFAANDVIGLALDLDSSTKTIKWYKNGSLAASKDLTANFVDHIVFANNLYNINSCIWNFGQDSTFAGAETAATNSDGNGIGKFHESVPSGYLALCSANLAELTIGPNSSTQADDHFDVLLYTGTGNDNLDVSGLKFKPDLVWKKSRTENVRNTWTDSSRGVGKDLFSDLAAGKESNDTAGIKAFNAPSSSGATDGGFRLGTSTNHNVNTKTYVAWNWKANDNSGTGISVGSVSSGVPSIASTVQANTTAGFSIVAFTGNNVTNSTIGHGLGATPAMIITKNRDDDVVSSVNVHWRVFHQNLTDTYTEFLSRPLYEVAPSGHSNGYIHDVTSTTYKTTHANVDSNAVNGSGDDMIAYCWAEVEGYSKFGIYTTNALADGPFVYTGFKPAFVMVKNISGSSNGAYWSWTVHDDTRVSFNPRHTPLYANLYRPEGYRGDDSTNTGGADMKIDFYSNGFKDRSGATEQNGVAGGKIIYMAFASQPFKYTNAE